MSAEFSYKNLTASDSIRLLLLQPRAASKDDEIHCNLQHTTLSECQNDLTFHYIALSYVWGNEEEQGRIFVEGVERHVTANLVRALRSIRHESKELPLWVDAVCINQQNAKERSQQVRFMGSIYAAARNTIIYLGESDENSDRAMEALKDDSSLDPLDYDETIKSCIVSSILSRTWFTRVWVLQELALSQNPIIQCGQSRVNWGRLPSFLSYIDGYLNSRANITSTPQPQLPETEQLMMDMQEAREKIQIGNINRKLIQKHQTLLDLVRSRSGLGAKDPRDMIFAHIGMVNHISGDQVDFRAISRASTLLSLEGLEHKDSTSSPLQSNLVSTQQSSASVRAVSQVDSNWTGQDITIDYEKTVAEVYNEFAQRAIENSGDLSIAHQIQTTRPQARLPGLASWAPDWTLREQQQIVPISGLIQAPHFIPSEHVFPTFVQGNPILGLPGYPLSRIRSTSQVIDLHNWDYTPDNDPDKGRPNIPTYTGLITEKHILLYRAIYGRMRQKLGHGVLLPLVERNMRDYYANMSGLLKENILWALGVSDAGSINTRTIADYLGERSIIEGRRVALLENSLNALVPACAEKGDHLFLSNSHPALIILRGYKGTVDLSVESSLRSPIEIHLKSRPSFGRPPLRLPPTARLPVRHYTFIGDGFDNRRDHRSIEDTGPRDYHIVALH
ncbi:Heterokaryon incompatibility protein 6,OR allele [Lachnellula hyalina]|uniref:Heterokaryon incompatibility protein 6,OR allele n=1 Tax=Lachnellula hyalina TaxID=1316788 RepID=A0A8H8R2K9_9HELO|nr:Heterokaryon incompatibility protein 6,OR allele [Lachnellula hyalina]TVY26911.1 Heterokaryon incompatibility protein 6,OR allele [Lachnellula hyalina]